MIFVLRERVRFRIVGQPGLCLEQRETLGLKRGPREGEIQPGIPDAVQSIDQILGHALFHGGKVDATVLSKKERQILFEATSVLQYDLPHKQDP